MPAQMNLRIERDIFTVSSSTGRLYLDGTFFCVTLEPTARPAGIKVPGKTAIPEGIYPVKMQFSPHFNTETPHVLNVPDFSEIEMHVGNYPSDTEGCTLLGTQRGRDIIFNSKSAVEALYGKINQFLAQNPDGEIWATYENVQAEGKAA